MTIPSPTHQLDEAPPPPWLTEMVSRWGGSRILVPLWPEHPILPFTQALAQKLLADGGIAGLNAYSEKRNHRLRREKENPFKWGFEPTVWKLADVLWGWISWAEFCAEPDVPAAWKTEAVRKMAAQRPPLLLILGGNRAAKTEYICKRIVQCLDRHPGAHIWLMHSNEAMSIEYHQAVVWKYLPPAWRELGNTRVGSVSYSIKNGFTGEKLVAEQGGVLSFRTYAQYEARPDTFEGGNLGAPSRQTCIGYGADELVPFSLWDTLRARISTHEGTGVTGFTPVEGYTDVVAQFLNEAAPILRDTVDGAEDAQGNVLVSERLEQPKDSGQAVVYFFSKDNPFGNYPSLLRRYAKSTREVKLMRFSGKPSNRKDPVFPKFSEAHLFDPEQLPAEGTRWHIADPAGRRNWFMLWALVDAYRRVWVYREWPCSKIAIPAIGGFPEPWAEPGSNKTHRHGGLPGGGSRMLIALTLAQIKNEIARLEGWTDCEEGLLRVEEWNALHGARERIKGRILDRRFAHTPKQSELGNRDLMTECHQLRLPFLEGPAGTIDAGLKLINGALGHEDHWRMPQDGPKLFISRECENLIFALRAYTGFGGEDEATKDPIDCLRYIFQHPVQYCPFDQQFAPAGGPRGYGSRGGPPKRDPSLKPFGPETRLAGGARSLSRR